MSANAIARRFILPFLAEYHDSAPDDERRTLIREIFIPKRVTPGGLRSVPVRLPVRRRARVRCADASWEGTTRSLSLDRVDLDLARAETRDLRCPLEVAIEATIPGLWWRFVGHATRALGRGRRVVIELDRTLGCEMRRPQASQQEATPTSHAGGANGPSAC